MSSNSTRKPLPFVANFAAGAIAGVSEILTFYPLDVVKTRMQLDIGKTSVGLVGSLRAIIAQEGFGRLYRGLAAPLLLEAPKRAVKFASNDFWGTTFLSTTGSKKMTQGLSIATGCAAGATESFVVVPFELVKIRLQDKSSMYAGPMDVVRQTVRTEGPLGLYAGMEATFWRSIFQVRSLLPKAETRGAELFNNFVAGAIGGGVGTVLNTPFDVVKSRIQGAAKPPPGQLPKYNWTYPALATILREEGPKALYKGFVPKVVRLAPGGGVLLLVVEFTLDIFRKANGKTFPVSSFYAKLLNRKSSRVGAPDSMFTAGPITESDMFTWEALICGPKDTPFPQDYPLSPFKMKFDPPIFHPNIYPDGNVCISILHTPGDDPTMYEKASERWSPVQSVEKVILSAEPNLESGSFFEHSRVHVHVKKVSLHIFIPENTMRIHSPDQFHEFIKPGYNRRSPSERNE
ncbi:hypothetical protein Clacol_008259 [Clathrus columnatus]|uniref:UBC core domain-containing protein n=1 Tax=Clathrus columnatus TaxID=1419009 RepID=A0AAV5AJS0_9AGAM|nr:hypothetical protein Clacol_008259 [Clathrus columnatus]